jgi:hypothetical protein
MQVYMLLLLLLLLLLLCYAMASTHAFTVRALSLSPRYYVRTLTPLLGTHAYLPIQVVANPDGMSFAKDNTKPIGE